MQANLPPGFCFGDTEMLRKTACAVAGLALACTAGISIAKVSQSDEIANLDLRWLQGASKTDRLPIAAMQQTDTETAAVDLPAASTTIVTKRPVQPKLESALRPVRVRTIRIVPANPVRDVTTEQASKQKPAEKLPVGCEPAFSPVTNPAFAHIGVRCDS